MAWDKSVETDISVGYRNFQCQTNESGKWEECCPNESGYTLTCGKKEDLEKWPLTGAAPSVLGTSQDTQTKRICRKRKRVQTDDNEKEEGENENNTDWKLYQVVVPALHGTDRYRDFIKTLDSPPSNINCNSFDEEYGGDEENTSGEEESKERVIVRRTKKLPKTPLDIYKKYTRKKKKCKSWKKRIRKMRSKHAKECEGCLKKDRTYSKRDREWKLTKAVLTLAAAPRAWYRNLVAHRRETRRTREFQVPQVFSSDDNDDGTISNGFCPKWEETRAQEFLSTHKFHCRICKKNRILTFKAAGHFQTKWKLVKVDLPADTLPEDRYREFIDRWQKLSALLGNIHDQMNNIVEVTISDEEERTVENNIECIRLSGVEDDEVANKPAYESFFDWRFMKVKIPKRKVRRSYYRQALKKHLSKVYLDDYTDDDRDDTNEQFEGAQDEKMIFSDGEEENGNGSVILIDDRDEDENYGRGGLLDEYDDDEKNDDNKSKEDGEVLEDDEDEGIGLEERPLKRRKIENIIMVA